MNAFNLSKSKRKGICSKCGESDTPKVDPRIGANPLPAHKCQKVLADSGGTHGPEDGKPKRI